LSVSERLVGWGLSVSLSACSLGKLETTPCTNNAECRDSFGLNAVCAEEGLCRVEPAAARCDRTYPEDLYSRPERYPEVVVIGNLMDRSEPKKEVRENAARLAAMQVDQVGGLEGRQLAMVFCTIEPNFLGDGVELADAAVATAHYLVDVVGVPAIVGPSSSGNTLAVFQALQGTGTLVISPSATSPALSEAEPNAVDDVNPGLLWRTAPSDSIQGELIAQDMEDRGVTSVAAVVQEGAYGDGLYQAFVDNLPSTISSEREPFSLSVERDEALTRVAGLAVEEVLFISSLGGDIRAFLTVAEKNSGYVGKSLFLTDAAASSDELAGFDSDLLARLRGTRPKPLSEEDFAFGNFLTGYETAYDQDPRQFSFAAHAYDATWLVFYGSGWAHLNESGLVSGKGIARGMRRVSSAPEPIEVIPTNWSSILDQFAKGNSVDVVGASGALDFDPLTEETTGPLEVWIAVVDGNGDVTIGPASP